MPSEFKKSLKNKYPKYHALKYQNITATALDVQKKLDKNSLLLEYFVSEEKTYLFAVSQQDVQVFVINFSKKELQEKIHFLRMSLSNYKFILEQKDKSKTLFTETAYWCYKELLRPALKLYPNINQLIIIPDNELGHIPFETFLVTTANQSNAYNEMHYLLNDYQVSYNYSATLFLESQQGSSSNQSNGQMLACAGDYTKQKDNNLHQRNVYLSELRSTLKPLPAAQKEVNALSKIFKGDFKYGKEANEVFFKTAAPSYSIIHLAMHGMLHKRVPILSSLAFTENQDSVEDNFLQAYEIAHLQLNAELVVLSACETGYGKFEQGEGVLSLARSFMYAGVPSLVVSLWQVNDESTAIIMQQFYQNLADGFHKAAALRQAKLNFIEHAEGIIAHPAFWSAFVQIGDNRPIYIQTKSSWTFWILGLGLLILGIVVILGMKIK